MVSSARPEVYAIDFGTTNSLIAAAGSTVIHRALPVDPGAPDPTVFRSILHFDAEGACSFGAQALVRYRESGMQGRLVRSLKRHLPSRSFSSTQVASRSYRLEELIGGMLRTLRERANAYFECEVERVVLGRPARFSEDADDDQFAEERLKDAARLAGFKEIGFCPEPLAAAHDFRGLLQKPKLVLVADLGGGTSDFSLIRMHTDGYEPEDVLATGGVGVAGDALDGALMRFRIAHQFGAKARYRAPFGKNELTMPLSLVHQLYSPVDMSLLNKREVLDFLARVRSFTVSDADRAAVGRLLVAAEDALGFQVYEAIESVKRELAGEPTVQWATFSLDYPELELAEAIARDHFATAIGECLAAIFAEIENTLAIANVGPEAVEVVCCTGGSAKVWWIAEWLRTMFPNAELHHLSSFRAVVDGLARHAQAALLGGAFDA